LNNWTGALGGNAEYLIGSSAARPFSSSAHCRLHSVDEDSTDSQQQTDTTGQLTAPGARPHDHTNPRKRCHNEPRPTEQQRVFEEKKWLKTHRKAAYRLPYSHI